MSPVFRQEATFLPRVMTMINLLVIVQHDSRWCSIRESSQQLTSTQVSTRLSLVNASEALRRRVGRLVQCVLFPNFATSPTPPSSIFQLTALLALFKHTVFTSEGIHMTSNDYSR